MQQWILQKRIHLSPLPDRLCHLQLPHCLHFLQSQCQRNWIRHQTHGSLQLPMPRWVLRDQCLRSLSALQPTVCHLRSFRQQLYFLQCFPQLRAPAELLRLRCWVLLAQQQVRSLQSHLHHLRRLLSLLFELSRFESTFGNQQSSVQNLQLQHHWRLRRARLRLHRCHLH